MSNNVRGALVLIFIGSVIVIIYLIIRALFFGLDPVNYTNHTPLPMTPPFSVADSQKENTFIYSNGRSFVEYNYITGDTNPISPDGNIPNLSQLELSPSGKYLSFRTSNLMFDDPLGKIVLANELALNDIYWWLYDLENNVYILVDEGVEVFRWVRDGTDDYYVILDEYFGTTLDKRTIDNNSVNVEFIQDDKIDDFFPIDGGVIYETSKNDIKTFRDGQIDTLFSDVNNLTVSPNKQWVSANTIVSFGEEDITLVVSRVDGSDSKNLGVIDEGFSTWDKEGANLIYNVDDELGIISYDLDNGERFDLVIDNESIPIIEGLTEVLYALDNDVLLMRTEHAEHDLISTGEIANIFEDRGYARTLGDGTEITYDDRVRRFLVNVLGDNTRSKRQAVYSQLEADSIDPELFRMSFLESVNDKSAAPEEFFIQAQ